jgi:hypothetical protein
MKTLVAVLGVTLAAADLTTGFVGTPYLCHVLSRFGEWMCRVVAGLERDPAEPGYKHVLSVRQVAPYAANTFTGSLLKTLDEELATVL